MTNRLIVAAVAIPIIILIAILAPVWLLGILVGAIAACSAWELVRCAEKNIPPRFLAYAAVCAFCIPFLASFYDAGRISVIFLFLLFVIVFCELILSFRKEQVMDFRSATVIVLAGGVIPIFLSSIVRLGLHDNGHVYALLPFVITFSSDAGGYFAGILFGKHKLAPRLSPHKTMEGSVGCFVAAIVLTLLYGLILKAAKFDVNFAVIGVYGFLGSLFAQLGDISFSAIKRELGIKDYGNLLPGHGGALDRFDSMIWSAVLLELLVAWVPAITKIVE